MNFLVVFATTSSFGYDVTQSQCISGGLSTLTVAVLSGFGGFIVSVLVSSVVWWRVLKRSKNAKKNSDKKEQSANEQPYDDVRADTQDQQPSYEVVRQATTPEEEARRDATQEPSYEPTYVGAKEKSTYDVININVIEYEEPTTGKKKETAYEATYVDGGGLQSGYDVINQENIDPYEQDVSNRPTTSNADYETIG